MYTPDFRNLVNAAFNRPSAHIPIYDHSISPSVIERITSERFADLSQGNHADKVEFFRRYNAFQRDMGYDATVYEYCASSVMPGSGALGNHKDSVIKTREDFDRYPWGEVPALFFEKSTEHYTALRESLLSGMPAVGGVGNGVFECVQDVVGYEELCYIRIDDEDLYRDLFRAAGDMLYAIWERFLAEFGDIFCVFRIGDDLGFKSTTLLSDKEIREHIIPQYRRIIALIHKSGKPFLLHSCGKIFDVMDDFISEAGIDAKHSNEDVIAPFSQWIEQYGDSIGNFGGLDTDVLCHLSGVDIVEYTSHIYRICAEKGRGVAIGSGNSIPDYVDPQRYCKAVETIRRLRGDVGSFPF